MVDKIDALSCNSTTVAELYNLKISQQDIKPFFNKGAQVHNYFSKIEGYSSMEIFLINENNVMVIIRWKNAQLFEKNLSQILNACPINDWFKEANSIEHYPVISKEFN